MIVFSAVFYLLSLIVRTRAVPVTQSTSTLADTAAYDAVVFGTNSVVELVLAAAITGTALPTAISALSNADIFNCATGEVCIGAVITDSAGHVASSTVAEYVALPASISAAIENIVDDIAAGIDAGRTAGRITESSATNMANSLSAVIDSSKGATRTDVLAGAIATSSRTSSPLPIENSTPYVGYSGSASASIAYSGQTAPATQSRSTSLVGSLSASMLSPSSFQTLSVGTNSVTAIIPTVPITFDMQVSNTQGFISEDLVEVDYPSGVPTTRILSAYADSITTTETSLPSGVSIQTITTSTCTTAGAVVTTTSSGSTVATEVPELCTHGLAFLIFGLPGFHSSSDLPELCHKSFSFPLGVVWTVLCHDTGPPTFSFGSVDSSKLPPGGGPPGANPNDGTPDDQKPTDSPTQTQKPTSTSQFQISTRSVSSTVSTLGAPSLTRYMVAPLIDTSQSELDSLFAPYASRTGVAAPKRSDGTLKFFALELNDTEAEVIDTNTNFVVIKEAINITEPDSGPTDPDLNGSNYTSEPRDQNPNVGSRDLHGDYASSKSPGIFRRFPLQYWAGKITWWTLAMISLVPDLPLPSYRLDESGSIYPYYYPHSVEPGQNVRVYLLDSGLNMQHPEFNGRLKSGITHGQSETDWDVDWLFPEVDTNEKFYAADPNTGLPTMQSNTFSYINPDTPNPNGGIHPAYSDFRYRSVPVGSLTPHGTRVSGFIIGDTLGQAQKCRYTVVKLPQYTNGPRADYALFPIFSVRDALVLIVEDILQRQEQGERLFVISSSLGYPFDSDQDSNPISAERSFKRMWSNFLNWCDTNGVAIVAAAGNSRSTNDYSDISLIPARLFRAPEMVMGSAMPNGLAHPGSQGNIGDGILTAFAPGAGCRAVSNDANGAYTYEFFNPNQNAVTSYACGHGVGYVAQMMAIGYGGNPDIPPDAGEKPNAYAYRMMTTLARARVVGGPPIIYNNAPLALYQDCGGPAGFKKRDGACPLASIGLPEAPNALPDSVSAAIVAGNGAQIDGMGTGISPSLTSALAGIVGDIGAGISVGDATATALPSSVTAALDAIIGAIGAAVSGHVPSTLATATSRPPVVTSSPSVAVSTAIAAPPPSPSPNAGIAIWLQQYSSSSGAAVASWFAYSYKPGDPKLGNPCKSNDVGTTPVPDGTLVSDELQIFPSQMSISAYNQKLKYLSISASGIGWLQVAATGVQVANCNPVQNAESTACDSQHELTPRLKCEWVD